MKIKIIITFSVIILFFFCQKFEQTASPTKANIRALADTVGFSMTQEQIYAVVKSAEALESSSLKSIKEDFPDVHWIAGICPHDDHLYAGRVYVNLFQNLKAKRIVLFGVAHKAWKWEVEDVLIFDSFSYWKGPYGPVRVSPIREEIIAQLSDGEFLVNNEWQSEEHSVEGIIPFIQHYNPDAEIVSILVPYMNWERIDQLSNKLAKIFAQIIQKNNWQLGEDIAFVCSNDGDHYGDEDWGGNNYAIFGTDSTGYRKATDQDIDLAKETLTGELTSPKLQEFCKRVWGENDLKDYKIRWCGRFAIPLGLNTVRILMEDLNHSPLNGFLLQYDTSYHLGKLPLQNIGIGTTAPSNLHHWVGYTAIGYY